MKVIDEVLTQDWTPVGVSLRRLRYPWPVFVGNLDKFFEAEPDYRKFGSRVLDIAGQNFGEEEIEDSLWCGFPGRNVLYRASHGTVRQRTYAVTTEELSIGRIPNPLSFAFRGGVYGLPAIAMYAADHFDRYDMGADFISKIYDLQPEYSGLDKATRALFVFQSNEAEDFF